MRAIFLLVLLFSLGLYSYSQEEEQVYTKQELKQIAKEEKQAKREVEDKLLRETTRLILESHKFVLEAQTVGDGRGQRIPVSSTINFIAIDSLDAVIQLGTMHGAGYNGVGGITVDGRITKYDLKVIEGKKNTSYRLVIYIMTSLGSYDISLLISDTGSTDATIQGTTAGQLRYSGKILPIGLSRVYKGSSI